MAIIPALERQKEFKASFFGYTASLGYMRPRIKKQITKATRIRERMDTIPRHSGKGGAAH